MYSTMGVLLMVSFFVNTINYFNIKLIYISTKVSHIPHLLVNCSLFRIVRMADSFPIILINFLQRIRVWNFLFLIDNMDRFPCHCIQKSFIRQIISANRAQPLSRFSAAERWVMAFIAVFLVHETPPELFYIDIYFLIGF